MSDLNPRQRRFIENYVITLNATQAAKAAGYAESCAEVTAARLIKNDKVWARIEESLQEATARNHVKADHVLRELSIVGFSDVDHHIFTPDGRLVVRDGVRPEAIRAVQSVKVKRNKGGEIESAEFKLWDKLKALELLGKHLQMWTERVEHTHYDGMSPEQLRAEAAKRGIPVGDD